MKSEMLYALASSPHTDWTDISVLDLDASWLDFGDIFEGLSEGIEAFIGEIFDGL
ncbi:MAG: hypothetical protein ACI94Y_003842 [Maribacter sp.]|jgi:hypothetical protein